MINLLLSVDYTNYCVLTDLDLRVHIESGWNPSYLTVFDPAHRNVSIVSVKNQRFCEANTSLWLDVDKQGLRCDGGPVSSCGLRNMPERGQAAVPAAAAFVKYINIDLYGADHWYCQNSTAVERRNLFTFAGSYYHAYVKLASCDIPTGKSGIRLIKYRQTYSESYTNRYFPFRRS